MSARLPWCDLEANGDELACLTCDHPNCDAPDRVTRKNYNVHAHRWTKAKQAELRERIRYQSIETIAVAMGYDPATIRKYIRRDPVCKAIRDQQKRKWINDDLWRSMKAKRGRPQKPPSVPVEP